VPADDSSHQLAARGWLSEHPAAFRALLTSEGVPVEVRVGTCVFRRDDDSNGLYGIVSGAIGVEGGHRRQSPLLGHVFRSGEWFGIKAVLHGGPRELTYRALEPARLLYVARTRLAPLMQTDPDIAVRVGQLAEIGNRLGSWIARDLLTPDAGRRLASVLFRVLGAGEVFIGVNAVDYSGYPDCRAEFIGAFERAVNLATKAGVEGRGVRVRTPLIEMSKAQIIRRGVELGVDLSQTLSCYDPDGRGVACGRCDSCVIRARGMEEAGVVDRPVGNAAARRDA
jgi:CRP-like cAMP-binding protein